MSLIAVYREENKLTAMSDSASSLTKFGCVQPVATKIFLYEGKIIIQHCGLGTIASRYVHEHIEIFSQNYPNLSLREIPGALLEYFSKFADCSEMKQPGNKSTIFLISGWDEGRLVVLSTDTDSKQIKEETEPMVAYGVETELFKNTFKNQLKDTNSPFLSMIFAFGIVSMLLKANALYFDTSKLKIDELMEIDKNPEYKIVFGPVCKPFDFIVLEKDKDIIVHIEKDKEKKFLEL